MNSAEGYEGITQAKIGSDLPEMCINVREQPRVWEGAVIASHHYITHQEITAQYSIRIFFVALEFDRSRKGDQRPYAVTEEDSNAEYFPLIIYNHDGHLGIRINKDPKEEFRLPNAIETTAMPDEPSAGKWELSNEKFRISKKLYFLGEQLAISKDKLKVLQNKLAAIEADRRAFARKWAEGKGLISIKEAYDRAAVARAQALYFELRERIKFHVDVPEWCLTLMALWTMGTHVICELMAYPYLYFQAEKDSGKSRALETLALLSNNGRVWVDLNPAPLFRSIDILMPFIGLDEIEDLSEEAKITVRSLILSGYKFGAKVPRCDTGLGKSLSHILMFNVYCPKAFGSIKAPDPVLASRCVQVPILKTDNKEYTKRNPNKPIYKDALDELRDDLMLWSVEFGPILAAVDMEEVYAKYIKQFTGSTTRAVEIMLPLLAIFHALRLDDPELAEGDDDLAVKIAKEQAAFKEMVEEQAKSNTSGVNDTTARVMSALYNAAMNREDGYHITPMAIRKELGQLTEDESKFFNDQRIGGILGKFHIQKEKIHGGVTSYMSGWARQKQMDHVADIARKYNIKIFEDDETEENVRQDMLNSNLDRNFSNKPQQEDEE